MSFLNKLGSSKYLKKEDAMPTPLLLTISDCAEENVAMVGEQPKMKQVLYFSECEKGFVLGKTTGNQIASFLGEPGDTPAIWMGKQIVLYCDPDIMMAGKIVGGLRVRAPRIKPQPPQNPNAHGFGLKQSSGQSAQPAARPVTPPPVEEDDVPF